MAKNLYIKIKDGNIVGGDDFHDGNYAAQIDFLNKSKRYIPTVSKIEFNVKVLLKELKKVSKELDRKFNHIPKDPRVKMNIETAAQELNIGIFLTAEDLNKIIKNLKENKIYTLEDIQKHPNKDFWSQEKKLSGKPEIDRFFGFMRAIIQKYKL